jgi:hypothetical protein
MIDAESIGEILAIYRKHGWDLRRVLLSPHQKKAIEGKIEELFAGVDINESDLNAAWFSRQSKPHIIAWELRRLDRSPFALVELVGIEATSSELEETLSRTEERLRQTSPQRPTGH